MIISNCFPIKHIPNIERVLILFFRDIFAVYFWKELWFWRKLSFIKFINWRNIVVRINFFTSKKFGITFKYVFCILKTFSSRFPTSFLRPGWRNLKESINRSSKFKFTFFHVFLDTYSSTLIFFENEIYFSSVVGIQVSSPSTFDNCLINRCVS